MKLAVIPARGGSKRIPQKNIRQFCGMPIIAYSIEKAIESELFDRIVVSTDDKKIASVSRKYGAETPFIRPESLSDDYVGTNAVVKHAIQWYQQQGETVSIVCCIYATAPFLKIQYLQKGYDKLLNSNKSFAFSVASFPFPIQRAIRITAMGEIDVFCSKFINSRSQDLEQAYHDAGQFCWGKTEAFIQEKITYSTDSLPVVLPRYLVQDIDTLEDWYRAEIMFKSLQT